MPAAGDKCGGFAAAVGTGIEMDGTEATDGVGVGPESRRRDLKWTGTAPTASRLNRLFRLLQQIKDGIKV